MGKIFGYWGLEPLISPSDFSAKAFRLAHLDIHRFSQRFRTFKDEPDHRVAIAWWGDAFRMEMQRPAGSMTLSLSVSGIEDDCDIRIEFDKDHLKLSRDSFGRATLYWTRRGETIWFASHLQLLISMLKLKAISPEALYGYGCFSFVPTPLSPIKDVFSVDAGCERIWRVGNDENRPTLCPSFTRAQEWSEPQDQITDEHAATVRLRELLEDSIHKQLDPLPSDPVGVFLSGGLDSSITAALLVRAGIKVRAYTLDFGEYGFPESHFAKIVASHLSIPLVKVPAGPLDIRPMLKTTAAALDVPYGDGVTVPLFLLGKAARKDISIVFNGEGGDQLFGGWTNKPLIASSVYGDHHPEGGDFQREYLRTFHRLHGHEQFVYTKCFLKNNEGILPGNWLAEAFDKTQTHTLLHRLRRANLMIKGPQNIQPRATDLAAAHNLMVRTPFCDRALAEWTFQISADLWLRGPCEKYLLKRAVEDWLPSDVVWRRKRGMGVPLRPWLLGPMWREVREWLRPAVLKRDGCFQPNVALRIARGELGPQVQGRRIGEILWLLLMWQAWKEMHLDAGTILEFFGFTEFWKQLPFGYHESLR